MRVNKLYYLILIFIAFLSCKENRPTDDSKIREKYFRMEDTGWKSQQSIQTVEGINYTATEVPIPYYILKNEGTDNLLKADSIAHANKTERIIEFEFLQEEEKDLLQSGFTKLDYKKSVEYLSFGIQNDFYVVTTKNDTIKCEGVNFERSFKVAPTQKIMLFFTGIDPDEKIQLVYNDKLFGRGTLKFTFKEKITKLLL
jgi:hypothetical protein